MARHPTTVSSHRVVPVVDGWTVAPSPPGTHADEAARAALEGLPARVPGTVASALAAAGRDLDARDLDAEDWTFLTTLPDVGAHHGGERIVLRLGGIATIAEVLVDGRPVHSSPIDVRAPRDRPRRMPFGSTAPPSRSRSSAAR